MPDFVTLKLEDSRYSYKDGNSVKMYLLGRFLESDVYNFGAGSFENWALDDEALSTGGNITDLDKEGDNIILSDAIAEDPDKSPSLTIPKDEFVKILDKWADLFWEYPEEITITKDGDRFTIEAKYDPQKRKPFISSFFSQMFNKIRMIIKKFFS